MGSQSGPETIFVTRDELIKVGYLPADDPTMVLDRLVPPTKVITIPIGTSLDSSDELKDIRISRPNRELSDRLSHDLGDRPSQPINIPKPIRPQPSQPPEIIVDATLEGGLFQPSNPLNSSQISEDDSSGHREIRTMNRLSGPPPPHEIDHRFKRSSYPTRTPNYLDVQLFTTERPGTT